MVPERAGTGRELSKGHFRHTHLQAGTPFRIIGTVRADTKFRLGLFGYGRAVVRVEVLDGEILYAIRLFPPQSGGFNLCPADICQNANPPASQGPPARVEYCPGGEPDKRRMKIERYEPSAAIREQALAIANEAHLDLGGIEYLVNDRDSQHYFYDVNALSNFVTDAEHIVGFNPYQQLVDFILDQMSASDSTVAVDPGMVHSKI